MAAPVFKNPVIRWIDHRLPVFSYLHHEAYEYPTPKNLNYWWNFGSLAGFMLVVMIATGLILAMQYTPHVDHAFNSVERIMRDVNWGWLLRYLHMNGASMFFIVVYIHIFRGLYFGSYKAPRELLWQLGVLIYLLMMATAFMGYVLPWGQMSFWGATVITNLFSAMPVIGDEHRDAAVGRLLGRQPDAEPHVRAALPAAVRDPGGGGPAHRRAAPLRLEQPARHRHQGPAGHHPLPSVLHGEGHVRPRRLHDVLCLLGVLGAERAGRSGELRARPTRWSTPEHIVPEWYFLPFYAILRSIPDKLLGVIAMFASILILFILPWLDRSPVRAGTFRPVFKWFFWILVFDCVVLMFCGKYAPESYWMPFTFEIVDADTFTARVAAVRASRMTRRSMPWARCGASTPPAAISASRSCASASSARSTTSPTS